MSSACEVDVMCKHDENVSPYLRRPLRSYEEVMRIRKKIKHGEGEKSADGDASEKDADNVEPRR